MKNHEDEMIVLREPQSAIVDFWARMRFAGLLLVSLLAFNFLNLQITQTLESRWYRDLPYQVPLKEN